jgi:hypothetical protein
MTTAGDSGQQQSEISNDEQEQEGIEWFYLHGQAPTPHPKDARLFFPGQCVS